MVGNRRWQLLTRAWYRYSDFENKDDRDTALYLDGNCYARKTRPLFYIKKAPKTQTENLWYVLPIIIYACAPLGSESSGTSLWNTHPCIKPSIINGRCLCFVIYCYSLVLPF